MIVGYNLVNADENKIWTLAIYTNHVDEIIITKLNPNIEEDIIALASRDEGFVLCTA